MIYEFHKFEDRHGRESTAYDVQLNGCNRHFIFHNNPRHQRKAHCQECKVVIPREVPRIKFQASYYYGSGYYCILCGIKKLNSKKKNLQHNASVLNAEAIKLTDIVAICEEVANDEWYEKKMALGRMLQVISENQNKEE